MAPMTSTSARTMPRRGPSAASGRSCRCGERSTQPGRTSIAELRLPTRAPQLVVLRCTMLLSAGPPQLLQTGACTTNAACAARPWRREVPAYLAPGSFRRTDPAPVDGMSIVEVRGTPPARLLAVAPHLPCALVCCARGRPACGSAAHPPAARLLPCLPLEPCRGCRLTSSASAAPASRCP